MTTNIYKAITPIDLGLEISKRRKLSKISQKDLAFALNMKPAQLCKIEKGKNLASPRTINRIERCLNIADGSLLSLRQMAYSCSDEVDKINLTDPYQRFIVCNPEHTISNADLRALINRLEPAVKLYIEAENQLNMSHAFKYNKLGNARAMTSQNGITIAEQLRMDLNLGDALLYTSLPTLERNNIRLVFLDNLPPIIEKGGHPKLRTSFLFYDSLFHSPVICVNQKAAATNQLYNIAYEIGAYIRFQQLSRKNWKLQYPEWEFARAFASTLILPTNAVRDLIDSLNIANDQWNLPLLKSVANYFLVEPLTLLWRLNSLKRINKSTFNTHKNDPELRAPPPVGISYLSKHSWLNLIKARATR